MTWRLVAVWLTVRALVFAASYALTCLLAPAFQRRLLMEN